MLSPHQLSCFLATYEHGSLTAAAEELGYAQPSISEQIRGLERSLGVQLFRRVGRGVVPTTVADTLRPHAERVLAAVVGGPRRGAEREVLRDRDDPVRHVRRRPPVRRRGADRRRARAAPGRPGRADRPELLRGPGRPAPRPARGRDDRHPAGDQRGHGRCARSPATSSSTSAPTRSGWPRRSPRSGWPRPRWSCRTRRFRSEDSVRILLRQWLHESGLNPQTRIEVEDPEIAVELVGLGLADSVVPKGAAEQLLPRLAPNAGVGRPSGRSSTTRSRSCTGPGRPSPPPRG